MEKTMTSSATMPEIAIGVPSGTPEPDGLHQMGPRRASYNPATGALLGHVPLVGPEGVDAAIRAAREAQAGWAARSPRQRAEALRQFNHALVADLDAVARLISIEQGKPVPEAMSIELLSVLHHVKWLASDGAKALESHATALTHPLFTAKRARYLYDPLGVVAIISPWNYPFVLPAIQAMTALLAGNGVILKPSPYTPLIGQKIAELARQCDLPAGLFSVLHMEDQDASYLTSHAGIAKIVFTGSVETGRKVMASAAQVPTPVVLELGGKDAALVAADADLKRAVPGIAWYAIANTGQTCAGVERALVHRDVYDLFVAESVELVKKLRVGEGLAGNDVGPLTNEEQLRVVEEQVEDARSKGASVLVGGYRLAGPGFFYAPTVLVDVTRDMRVMQEETFGPVLAIARVDSMEQAIREANDTPYSLTASIWTRSERQGLEWARELRAGAVNINDHAFHFGDPAAAWGGAGQSGFGRTHGHFGLMEMVNPKFVSSDSRRGVLEPWWYPYNENLSHLLRNSVRMLYGPGERRAWALTSLLFNPRTWQRIDMARFAAAFRKWL